MIEKIKNFFYDCSDLLLGFIITVVMFGIIFWKLMGIMILPMDLDVFKSINRENDNIAITIPSDEKSNNIEESESIPIEPLGEQTSNEEIIQVNPIEYKDITISIPKGATGYSIAKLLKSKGIIENTNEFVSRVEELELGPKLRFGDFTINTGNSIDEIIYIITGIK